MPDKNKTSLMVTDFAAFYRCSGDQGERYYPASAIVRAAAIDYNGGTIPPIVNGYGVYDTTISTDYAVAMYGSEDEALQHQSSAPAPTAPVFLRHNHRIEPEIEEPEIEADDEDEEDSDDR